MTASDTHSRDQAGHGRQEWRVAVVLWSMVGLFCVALAHTLAASLL